MHNDLVTIYQAESFQIAELIHQRLSDNDIDAYVENVVSPLDGLNAAGQGPHVQVREQDARKAGELIATFLAEHADD